MTWDDWNASTSVKVQESWNLHESLPTGMHFFVMLSSMAGIFGNVAQSSYYAGNIYQDALARYIARCNNPYASDAQIEAEACDIDLPCSGLPVYHKAKFWLGHAQHHPLSSNEWDVAHAMPSRKSTTGDTVLG